MQFASVALRTYKSKELEVNKPIRLAWEVVYMYNMYIELRGVILMESCSSKVKSL